MAFVLKQETVSERSSAAREISGLAGFNLTDLADEGRERIEQCRNQIRQMLAAAEAEADSLRQQAEQQGYEQGLQRAAVDAERKLQQAAEMQAQQSLQVIRQAVEQLHSEYHSWLEQYSRVLTAMALSAAERLVMRELDDRRQLLTEWAAAAVRSTRAATQLTVAVHPETLAQLGSDFDQLLASPDLPEQTHVIADESVDRQSVQVRQNGGKVDAGLRAQLARLEELLS